jgi:hypothetical protein
MKEVNELVKNYMFYVFDELIEDKECDYNTNTFDKKDENYDDYWYTSFIDDITTINYDKSYSLFNEGEGCSILQYCDKNKIDYDKLMCRDCNNLKMLEDIVRYFTNEYGINIYDKHKIKNNKKILLLYAYTYLNKNDFEVEITEYYNNKSEYLLK